MMEDSIQWLLQGGALAILIYIVIWTTRTGAPGLFEALAGIRTAMERNTMRTESLEETTKQLTYAVRRMAEKTGTVGEHTLTTLRKHENRDPPDARSN